MGSGIFVRLFGKTLMVVPCKAYLLKSTKNNKKNAYG